MTNTNSFQINESKVNDSLVSDIDKKEFNKLLNECFKGSKEDNFYISLPRNEGLIVDFFRLFYYAMNANNFLELDKNSMVNSVNNIAKHMSFSNDNIPLAILKLDFDGNIIRIYQEEE